LLVILKNWNRRGVATTIGENEWRRKKRSSNYYWEWTMDIEEE
jgi:hypothetical protein